MDSVSSPMTDTADTATAPPPGSIPRPIHVHTPSDDASYSDSIDRIGALVSFVCAVHCILTPIVLAIPALGAGWFTDAALEHTLVGGALLIAGASAAWGFRKHRSWKVIRMFSLAAGLLIVSRVVGEASVVGSTLAIAGGLTLAGTHIYSRRVTCSCKE